MLGKLIKQDFKSLSRVLFPTQLAILAASIIGTISFAITIRKDTSAFLSNGAFEIVSAITGMLGGLMILAIIAAAFLVAFIIFERFYKSFMSDEGYLTFTLPVTTTQLLWSKLITAMIWTIISGFVIFVSVNIFIMFGTSGTTGSGMTTWQVYGEIGRAIREACATLGARVTWPIIEFIILFFISLAYNILHIYLALIIGGIVSQKHKLLAGIGFYFVISMATGIISAIIMQVLGTAAVGSLNRLNDLSLNMMNGVQAFDAIMTATQPVILCYMFVILALTAGFFLLSDYFIKNKLNLE